MAKNQISFKIIEYKPNIPNIIDYSFQIICYDTGLKDYINNEKNSITDYITIKKNLQYIIKLTKKGKILGVGSLTVNHEIFAKKIKSKKFNNINLFITENNYKKIFPKTDITKKNLYQAGINLTIELNIKYDIKEKEINKTKLKFKRNFSFQERANLKNDYSNKSSNILTASNTFHNINNCIDNNNDNDANINNIFASDKYILTTPPYIMSPPKNNISSLSASKLNNRKRRVKKEIIKNLSFKINNNNNKNKKNIFKSKTNYNGVKRNILEFKRQLNQQQQHSSRNNNKKLMHYRKKIKEVIHDSSSSKNSKSITQSSIIDSALIENNYNNINYNEYDNSRLNISNKIMNLNNETIQNTIIRKSAYNDDNEYDSFSIELNIKELENKKHKIIKEQHRLNKNLFNQEELYNRLYTTFDNYNNKINNIKNNIIKLKEKNDLLKYKEKMIKDENKDIIPIITKVKETKEIENNIIKLILNKYTHDNKNKNKNMHENNIDKYNKNLMIKILKNVIQSNHNIDLYLKNENKKLLKTICDKYNIFGSIIEDNEEE